MFGGWKETWTLSVGWIETKKPISLLVSRLPQVLFSVYLQYLLGEKYFSFVPPLPWEHQEVYK